MKSEFSSNDDDDDEACISRYKNLLIIEEKKKKKLYVKITYPTITDCLGTTSIGLKRNKTN